MRKVNNFFGLIGYIFLTISGVTYLLNKWLDYFYKEPELIEEPKETIQHNIHTVYPDNYDITNFNEWSNYIHKQLN